MSKELKTYVHEALLSGQSNDAIQTQLVEAGWSESVVLKILKQYAGVDAKHVPIPAPRQQAHHVARDLFLYALSLITLTFTALGLGSILFEIIERLVVDTTFNNNGDFMGYQLNHAVAQLIISAPLYFFIAHTIHKDIEQNTEKRESLIRKIMIYLLLAITSITMLCDFIEVLTKLLDGSITTQFILKSAVIIGISAIIFIYYILEVRQDDKLVKSKP